MFKIHKINCIYFDISNPKRSPSRDQEQSRDCFAAKSGAEASEIVLQILREAGGVNWLVPKIIMDTAKYIWIECETPIRTVNTAGERDICCLAIKVVCEESNDHEEDLSQRMHKFRETLGPNFHL